MYLKSIYTIIKRKIFCLFNYFLKISSPTIACQLNNFRQIIMGRNIVFKYIKNEDLFEVKDGNLKMYFKDKMRGMFTYSYGPANRADSLAKTYNLDLINFLENDTIVDCGANFGDIYTWFKTKKLKIKYISFEPSLDEFKCIQLNCRDQTNNQIALSNKIGQFDFYCKSDSGDSSLLEPANGFTKIIKIKTTTLDEYVERNKLEKIKLFKVEAEGYEPEILEGAINTLPKIEFIAVDGSPERGLNADTTIEEVKNFLIKNNFKLVSINTDGKWIKGLFKNLLFDATI